MQSCFQSSKMDSLRRRSLRAVSYQARLVCYEYSMFVVVMLVIAWVLNSEGFLYSFVAIQVHFSFRNSVVFLPAWLENYFIMDPLCTCLLHYLHTYMCSALFPSPPLFLLAGCQHNCGEEVGWYRGQVLVRDPGGGFMLSVGQCIISMGDVCQTLMKP